MGKLSVLTGQAAATVYPASDWVSYTPVVSNLTTGGVASALGKWRQVGDSMEVQFIVLKDATAGSGGAIVNLSLPSGYLINTASLSSAIPSGTVLGTASNNQAAATSTMYITYQGQTSSVAFIVNSSSAFLTGTGIPANSYLFGRFTVPIVGWTANTLMGASAQFQNARSKYQSATAAAVTAAFTTMVYDAKVYDDLNAYNTSTGVYTAQFTGEYRFTASFDVNAGSLVLSMQVLKNSVAFKYATAGSGATCMIEGTINLAAGDTLSIQKKIGTGTANVVAQTLYNQFEIERISSFTSGSAMGVQAATQIAPGFAVAGSIPGSPIGAVTTGSIGEVISKVGPSSGRQMVAASGAFQNAIFADATTFLTLTPGKWSLSAMVYFSNGNMTELSVGISADSVDTSFSDSVLAVNRTDYRSGTAFVCSNTIVVPPYDVIITTNTNYYVKISSAYSTAPAYRHSLRAQRIG